MGTFEMKMSPNILLGFFFFAVLCSSVEAKFVNRISDTEYEIKLNQSGAFFSQKVTLDKQHNLIITEVPAHHDRVAITNIFDSSTGLAMKIIPSLKKCDISRPFMSISAREQEDTLVAAAFDDSEEESLEISSKTAKTFNLAQIEGPELDFECVPEKFQKFVPEGYLVVLTHEVQVTRENFQMDSNHDKAFFTDPITQKKYNYGDHVELWSEIFDFAPECKTKRVKRSNSGWNDHRNGYCTNPGGQRVRCYGLKGVTCPEGCDAADSGFDCQNKARDCYFVLICPIVQGDACMAHLRTDLYKCHRCCRLRDCGSNLKICQYTSKTDTCPSPTEGCPYYKVESEFDFDTETDKTCDIDQRCSTVVSSAGDSGTSEAIGSGISCARSTRPKEFLRKFCCRNPTRHERSNLPACT